MMVFQLLLAQETQSNGIDIQKTFEPAENFFSVGSLLNILLPNLMTVAGIIAFIIVIVAGFKLIRSAGKGESQQVSKGKEAITAAVAGLVLVVTAYWLVQIIQMLTGVKIFDPGF